ncbi:acyl-CoA synthetase (NDP forming)/GNAT superfamily N-acetyltransferase [Kibdelosporangium banguiense]|uniref:Acyl-CoA synthetase (NDP forming)/GNAT superfamily N-acetyltransferase n=1 Tax=Kibdelosporangium banguiense TaxID=1365924 RepID=A0ABS4TXU6_9PSEU|nr:bifunctional GNAT family N-acetyltransferase/acetate--CoA ligase family protein [Kibdelosporangium banguiense]MBP2328790.1 acyl-CoA synthetase (NDP forming)/GNAT superfamily N-acetyltransferase [Kibdelosporangium banguiense]
MTMSTEAVKSLLADGTMVTVRQLGPADHEQVVALHQAMPDEDRYLRFFSMSSPPLDSFVNKVVSEDTANHGAVGIFEGETLLGMAAYVVIKGRSPVTGDVALVVSHQVQHHGIGTILLEHLGSLARSRGVRKFSADVLPSNWRMLQVFSNIGLPVHTRPDFDVIEVDIDLAPDDGYLDAVAVRERLADKASLQPLFRPDSVTVVGAGRKPESIGHAVLSNILAGGFTGAVTAVNPHAHEVLGIPCYRSVAAIPDVPDLAVLCVPAAAVPDVAAECGRVGVQALLVISSGLSTDPDLGKRLLETVRKHGMRMVGPNCLGIVNSEPAVRLDASFARGGLAMGDVGVVTQSGGIAIALLEELRRLGMGVSTMISTGDKYDVSGNDLLHWWENDIRTRIAVLYMESFGNPRKFSRLARHLARSKPVLAIRAGSTDVGQRAAASHTAATTTPTVLRDALFRQAGVIAVDRLSELTDTVALLARQPLPTSNRVAVVSNAGGAGVLAADACVQNGLVVPELSDETRKKLHAVLPALASVSNPVDTTAVVDDKVFTEALRIVLEDDGIDAVIAIAAPTALGDPADAIDVHTQKTVIAVRLGQVSAVDWLNQVPCFADAAAAAVALGHAAERAAWLRRPAGRTPELAGIDAEAARRVIHDYLAANTHGGWLGPEQVVTLLRALGLPVLGEMFAQDVNAAVAAQQEFDTPVAMKAVASGLLHKNRGGGVRLGLSNAEEVRAAFEGFADRFGTALHGVVVQPMVQPGRELLIGVSSDPMFGPLIVFGLGGVDTDMLDDRTARLVPVTDVDADEMLDAIRSAPKLFTSDVDKSAVRDVLLRVARLAELLPEVAELDINPLVVGQRGGIVVDARVRVMPTDYVDPFLRRMR